MMNRATTQDGTRVRLLPFPSAQLYLASTEPAAGAVWARLAAHSLEGKLSLWQRLSGAAVAPASRVWHLLYLHRRAFEAEMMGYRNQADFYWHDLTRRLRRVWNDSAAWDAAAAQLAGTVPDGTALRFLCMNELFLDSHIALANGLICAGAPYRSAQLALHMASVEDLMRVNALGEEEMADVLHPLVAAQVAGLMSADMHAEALAVLRGIKLPALKHRFAAALADLVFSNLMAALERLPEKVGAGRVGLIAAAINEIETLRVARPANTVLYQLLGFLHHMQCVQMANADMLADALVACEKARTYWPALEDIEETRQKLHAKMAELKNFIAELERQMRQGQMLSAEGLRLKADAERGFMPVQNFIASSASSAIAVARDAALAQAGSGADEDPAATTIDERLRIPPHSQRAGKAWSRLLWLFAVQDRRSQAMLAGALAFNLAVGAVVGFESYQRSSRDEAVASLSAPGASDEQVMAAAVRFLRAQTPGFRDPRTPDVNDAYARAFIRWFGNIADPAEAGASTRIAEYRDLGSQGELP